MSSLLYINEDEIKSLLKWEELLPLIERGLSNFSKGLDGGIVQPVRNIFNISKYNGFLGAMAAFSDADNAMTTKSVRFFANNPNIGLNAVMATILLMDPTNGKLRAVLDGDFISEMRTAAVSVVATKYLAPTNPKILAIIGAGKQGGIHYKALRFLYKFEEIRIWNRTPERGIKLCEAIKESGDNVSFHDSVETAVQDADIIVTATSTSSPLVKAEWVKPGAHVNAVGSFKPDWNELYPELVRESVVYVDSREACLKEGGDIIKAKAEVYAEIGEVINGQKEAYRNKTTVFKSVGLAFEDTVTAQLVYEIYQNQQHS